jgi:hypothetical protein
MNQTFKLSAAASAVALLFAANAADASHFRGGAMIPTVSASGLLTINATTFWRPTAVADIDEGGSLALSGAGSGSLVQQGAQVNNTTDIRFTQVTSTHTVQLPGAGLYNVSATSCCRVGGIQNASESSWELTSQVFWNGSTATTPILFNFSAVQPEVVRGANYNGNLGATSLSGFTLSYDQALNLNINSQPPGFTINTSTGQLFIPAASTATYSDNPSNVGADYAFSGHIFAHQGANLRGSVEFDWLFDAVNTGSANLAPTVTDAIISALTAGQVNHTFTATDDGNPVPPGTVSFLAGLNFTPGCGGAATFNNTTGAFSWDATGCADGTYIAQVTATDGSLTDVGLLTISIGQIITPPPPTGAPEPGTLALLGAGFGIAELLRRRRRSK